MREIDGPKSFPPELPLPARHVSSQVRGIAIILPPDMKVPLLYQKERELSKFSLSRGSIRQNRPPIGEGSGEPLS